MLSLLWAQGSIPGQGTKTLQAPWCGQEKKENMRFAWGKNLWLGQVPGCKSWLLRLARGGLRSATGPSSCVTVQDKTCHLIRWLCWEDPLEKGTAMHSSTLA